MRDGLDALAMAQQLAADGYEPAEGVEYAGHRQRVPAARPPHQGRRQRAGRHDRHGRLRHPREPGHPRAATSSTAWASWPRRWRRSSTDLGDRAADVTVMVSSEFGRRVSQNGTGTDHGHGGVVTMLSGKPLAGSLLGRWDGLDELDNGDVPEYNNMFDVFGSVMQGRFGLTERRGGQGLPPSEVRPGEALRVSDRGGSRRRGSSPGRYLATAARRPTRPPPTPPTSWTGGAPARRRVLVTLFWLGLVLSRAAVVVRHAGRLADNRRRVRRRRPRAGSPASSPATCCWCRCC